MYGLPGVAVAAALAVAGCSSPAPEDYDAGHFDAARRVCFPSVSAGRDVHGGQPLRAHGEPLS